MALSQSRRSKSAALLLASLALAAIASAATRPHYGGTLRVEMRESPPSPEAFGVLKGFVLTTWEAGRRAVFTADENAPGGRPFLDTVDIQMARSLRDQSTDLELGKADMIELGPAELRRQPASRRVWSSSPVRLMALVFGPPDLRRTRSRSPRPHRGPHRHPQRPPATAR
ncbi:MAG: hypothetical protein WDO73_06870 [Ignavibacteriota bacterium]